MAKRHVDTYLSGLAEIARRLAEGEDRMSAAEIDKALADAGTDPSGLVARLHSGANNLSIALANSSRPTPRYLEQVIHATRPLEQIDGADPEADGPRLSDWLDLLRSQLFEVLSAEGLTLARAWRNKGDLSIEDARKLDELEAELVARLRDRHEKE